MFSLCTNDTASCLLCLVIIRLRPLNTRQKFNRYNVPHCCISRLEGTVTPFSFLPHIYHSRRRAPPNIDAIKRLCQVHSAAFSTAFCLAHIAASQNIRHRSRGSSVVFRILLSLRVTISEQSAIDRGLLHNSKCLLKLQ